MDNSQINLKKSLLETAKNKQSSIAQDAKAAMNEAQEGANEEKGSMEEKFESFRNQLQQDRDMYAKQYIEAEDKLEILYRISAQKTKTSVELGSVVITETKQRFFVSISLGELKIDGISYFAISREAPIYQAMVGKKKGDTFEFRGNQVKIIDLF